MSFLSSLLNRQHAARLVKDALREGALPERIAKLEAALDLYEKARHPRGQAQALYRIGQFKDTVGEKKAARECLQRAQAIAEDISDTRLASEIHGQLASPYVQRGGTDWEGENASRRRRWEPASPHADRHLSDLAATTLEIFKAKQSLDSLPPRHTRDLPPQRFVGAGHGYDIVTVNLDEKTMALVRIEPSQSTDAPRPAYAGDGDAIRECATLFAQFFEGLDVTQRMGQEMRWLPFLEVRPSTCSYSIRANLSEHPVVSLEVNDESPTHPFESEEEKSQRADRSRHFGLQSARRLAEMGLPVSSSCKIAVRRAGEASQSTKEMVFDLRGRHL